MFNYADRIPTGTPLPQGHLTPAPWGLRRLASYPAVEGEHTRVVIDPATQTGRYFNAAGVPVASPGHGTSSGTNPSTGTSPDGQGGGSTDSDTGNDTDQ